MTESEFRRRLRVAGYVFEPSPAGKYLWRQPSTGHLLPEDKAAALVRKEEARQLKEAGWEPLKGEGEGEAYWRRPDTGRLYPRGAAYDVMRRLQEERREEGKTS
jgi:hypothetical protein